MPPAKKKTKTTMTEKVPAAAAAAGRSLTDLNDETLERVASFLSPPSVYNLARASKKTFWAERDDGAPPLGTTLAQAALRRQLARVVRAVTRRRAPRDDGRPAFELMDVFPDELVPKDAREAPRALLSGSVAVQAAIGVGGDETEDEEEEDEEEVEDNDDDDDDDDDDDGGGDDDDDDDGGGDDDDDDDDDEKEPWAGADVDVFCTFEAAPFVRRRLIERCGLVCSGVDNDYMQQRSDADYDAPGSSLNAISHVESYSARQTSGVTTDRGNYEDLDDDLEYASDAYYEKAKAWGAAAVKQSRGTDRDPHFFTFLVGRPDGSGDGGDFLYDYELRDEKFVQLVVGLPRVKDARELLESFDLEICKCSFDGRTFRVPAPENTFASRTVVTPARRALVDDFMEKREKWAANVTETIANYDCNVAIALAKMTKKVWKDLGVNPFKEDGTKGGLFDRSRVDFASKYTFLTTLIKRMQKYARRGVEILDPPSGALEWDVVEFVEG
jgi:hypothetical protein